MSEDQAFYQAADAVSADAPKPVSTADRLWEIFRFGRKSGIQQSQGLRLRADELRDEAAEIIAGLLVEMDPYEHAETTCIEFVTAMRSPEEVREELASTDRFLQQIGYTQDEAKHWVGYGCALKWVLREEE